MLEKVKCPMCKSEDIQLLYEDYPGYVRGTYYNINKCNNCNIQFVYPNDFDENIYDIIYSKNVFQAYNRYTKYSKDVLQKKDPFGYLCEVESSVYVPLKEFLKTKVKDIKILEVGCGRGYLTYSLIKAGYNAHGIDLSSEAIEFAKQNYGDHFINENVMNYKFEEKYDLIVATELIEHLKTPYEFIDKLKSNLTEEGSIFITTPNISWSKEGLIWKTDQPPIHLTWLSKKSFDIIGKKLGMKVEYYNYKKMLEKRENNLLRYFAAQTNIIPHSVIDENGKKLDNKSNIKNNIPFKFINKFKLLMNYILRMFNDNYWTICVILEKK